jgi:hypothetical protein
MMISELQVGSELPTGTPRSANKFEIMTSSNPAPIKACTEYLVRITVLQPGSIGFPMWRSSIHFIEPGQPNEEEYIFSAMLK